MKEIRIYYECLEQAAHFIKPIIESSPEYKKSPFEIRLIKLKGNYSYYSKNIAKVVFLKDPDILISIVDKEIEYPLFQLEISTAVFTEDHELQRFDGILASVESNCLYGKLSPLNKKSPSGHGGNTNFNHLTSYATIYNKHKIMSYHFDWPCDAKGCVVDEVYLSCPQKIETLEIFLKCLVAFAIKGLPDSNWISKFEKSVVGNEFFDILKKKLESFELQNLTMLSSTRTEWVEKDKTLFLKFNRFGHAMDPERGMLAYFGTVHASIISKMVFNKSSETWYKTVSKETIIREFIKKTKLLKPYDFLQTFVWALSLDKNKDFIEILKKVNKTQKEAIEIDLTNFVKNNYYKVNKPLRIIFRFSKGFYIYDDAGNVKVKFSWLFKEQNLDLSTNPSVTEIRERIILDEDDITYICVHDVFRVNKYKLIAVSYPGAQGDRVALDSTEHGRTRKRRYVDIISYLPNSHTAIHENKGEFKKQEILEAIEKLELYKNNMIHKKSINTIIDHFDNKAPKILKIGIGFWANRLFNITAIKDLPLDELDYFIYIKRDLSGWVIWSNNGGKLFSKTAGGISIPETFEVGSPNVELQLFKF